MIEYYLFFHILTKENFFYIWNDFLFKIIATKYFIFFLLCYPLLVGLVYLLLYLYWNTSGKHFNYAGSFHFKNLIIFFSFFYFFLFVLLLMDFIYYIDLHKIFFNLSLNEVSFLKIEKK